MVEGASLELSKVKETLEAKISEKGQEIITLSQVQNSPPKNAKMEAQLNKLTHWEDESSHCSCGRVASLLAHGSPLSL